MRIGMCWVSGCRGVVAVDLVASVSAIGVICLRFRDRMFFAWSHESKLGRSWDATE
jgi:hypothetical protein